MLCRKARPFLNTGWKNTGVFPQQVSVDTQGAWQHGAAAGAAALPAVLAWLPWRLYFKLPFKYICPLMLPRGQQQPAYHLFDWHAIYLCCKENLVLPLNRCLALSFLLGLKWCRLPSPPHPVDTHCQKLQPQNRTPGSTILHTLTPVFLQPFRFLAVLEQQVSCYCAFSFSALLVKFIVVKRPEHTGRERQLPSISSLGKV